MKDSHRTPQEFTNLQTIIRGKMNVFVFQGQYATYAGLGAAGLWSIDAWMGPWPHFALRDAVKRGDLEAAKAITLDIVPPNPPPANLSWRETASKIAIRMAGYVDPGPLRPPFVEIPPEVTERMSQRVERWQQICDKYRALVRRSSGRRIGGLSLRNVGTAAGGGRAVTKYGRSVNLVVCMACLAADALPARAQSVGDFYRGKTLTMVVGIAAGGGYDLSARTVARHIGGHIPGSPT